MPTAPGIKPKMLGRTIDQVADLRKIDDFVEFGIDFAFGETEDGAVDIDVFASDQAEET